VWMGAPGANVPMTNVGGIRVTGGSYPARIWHDFMVPSLAGLPSRPFPAPNMRLIAGGKFIDDSEISDDKVRTPTVAVDPAPPTTVVPVDPVVPDFPDEFPDDFPFTTRPPPGGTQPPPPDDDDDDDDFDDDCFPFCDEEPGGN